MKAIIVGKRDHNYSVNKRLYWRQCGMHYRPLGTKEIHTKGYIYIAVGQHRRRDWAQGPRRICLRSNINIGHWDNRASILPTQSIQVGRCEQSFLVNKWEKGGGVLEKKLTPTTFWDAQINCHVLPQEMCRGSTDRHNKICWTLPVEVPRNS